MIVCSCSKQAVHLRIQHQSASNLTGDHRLLLMCCSDRPEAFNAATEQDHLKGYVESMGSIVRYLSVG